MKLADLKVTASPHFRSHDSTSDIMFDVVIALVPASIFGVWRFGVNALILIMVCIASCLLFESGFEYITKRKITVADFSAVVTGLLLALNLPSGLPIWMAVIGSFFAIVVVKQLFGGLGQNFMNPALGARCFLVLAFSKAMTTFTYDGVTTATPLYLIKSGVKPTTTDIKNMFLGNIAGTIGETSAVALLIGAIYLLARKIISPKIPLIYIGTFAICIAIYAATKDYDVVNFTLAEVCGGGLMLGAFFMATDYVTSPITSKGRIVYGVILGLLTFVLRMYGNSAEGVSYAIILSNLLVPLIERCTAPKPFGYVKPEKKVAKEEIAKEDASETDSDKQAADDNKEEKDPVDKIGIIKSLISLSCITLVLGAVLGTVYNVTKDPIDDAAKAEKEEAYKELFPEADHFEFKSTGFSDPVNGKLECDDATIMIQDIYGYSGVTIDDYGYAFNENNQFMGFVFIVTSSKGYGGDIQAMIGVGPVYNIVGVEFLSIGETAGLGMNATNKEFREQYVNKTETQGYAVKRFSVTKTGATKPSEIDAISGATITSNAVTDMVNAVLCIMNGGN